jgi:PAS domain S-box-containing protein
MLEKDSLLMFAILVLTGIISYQYYLIRKFKRNYKSEDKHIKRKSNVDKKLFNIILDLIPLNIFLKDSKGRFLYVNKNTSEILNVNQFEILGKNDFDIFPKDVAYNLRKIDKKVLRTNITFSGEEKVRVKNEEKDFLVYKTTLKIDPISDAMLLGFSMDVTEKKKILNELESKNLLIQKILDISPNLIFLKDYDGNFLMINDAVEKLFNKPRSEILSNNNYYVHHKSEEVDNYNSIDRKVIDENRTISIEEPFTLPNGDTLYFYTTKIPFPNSSGKNHVLAFSIDITKIKNIELELKKNISIAERASEIKSQFLSTISHEIRTPLNGIIGCSSLLNQTTLNQAQKELLENLNNSSLHLLSIINDILDFSSFEKESILLNESIFNLKKLFNDLMILYKDKIKEKKLNFEYEIKIKNNEILSDGSRIRQVVNHLMTNAIKFTDSGSIKILVEEKEINSNETLIIFSISDTGIGISDEIKKDLFSPFYQSDSSNSRRFGGTGLGLAISKKIALKMNGDISYSSTYGQGSHFQFTFQIKNSIFRPIDQNKSIITNIKNPSEISIAILLAEDNIINQKIVEKIIKKIGFDIDIAANGLEVLEKTLQRKYDLIFMDVQMPLMDGLVATRRLLHRKEKIHPYIVALTANAMAGDKEICLNAGMDEYIAKPIDYQILSNFFKTFFRSRYNIDLRIQ